jgi:hypothetical protein
MPAIYATLGLLFRRLDDEYDDQGPETSRYQAIMTALQDPLLALLRADGESAELVLERLGAVLGAFHRL